MYFHNIERSYFMKKLHILPNSPFLKFCPTPPRSFCWLVTLTKWVIVPHWTCFTCQALVSYYYKVLAVWFMQQDVSLLRSNAWCGFLLVLWFDISHAQKTSGTEWSQYTDPPTWLYINCTCYELKAALCIKLNE